MIDSSIYDVDSFEAISNYEVRHEKSQCAFKTFKELRKKAILKYAHGTLDVAT